jgi:hypothetical protein
MKLTVKTGNGVRRTTVSSRFSSLLTAHSDCPTERSNDGALFTFLAPLFPALRTSHFLCYPHQP